MNLKLFRKLLILCVLSVGLFFAVSTNTVSAEVMDCCTDCQTSYDNCIQYTCSYIQQCVDNYCTPRFYSCSETCAPTICY